MHYTRVARPCAALHGRLPLLMLQVSRHLGSIPSLLPLIDTLQTAIFLYARGESRRRTVSHNEAPSQYERVRLQGLDMPSQCGLAISPGEHAGTNLAQAQDRQN